MIEISPQVIVTVVSVLFGGGGVAALLKMFFDRSKGRREDALKQEQNSFAQLQEVIETLREEVDRLKASRAEDLEERRQDRARLDALEEQNRMYRWVLSEVLQRLHRMPEAIPTSDLIEFILTHIPNLRKDKE